MVNGRRRGGERTVRMQAVAFIGEEVKRWRLRRAWTQEELAEKSGLGLNTVNRIEGNRTEPRPPTIRKLADALGVDPSELVRT